MTIPATDTAIDIAYWFFNRAEKDGIYLETEKMQHLLFLAQIHFAMAYNMQILVPSLFVCNKDGFFEPNLKRMFAMGRPFMPPVKFPAKIDSFLESIWNKYGKTSLIGLEKLIKSNSAFKENCIAAANWPLPARRRTLSRRGRPWSALSSGITSLGRGDQGRPLRKPSSD